MKTRAYVCTVILAGLTTTLGFARAESPITNPAATPAIRNTWLDEHNRLNNRVQSFDPTLVFVGDSITEHWKGIGKDVWNKHYAPLRSLNLGVSGDRTENILWRLQNGNLEGLHPKALVVLAGINNIHRDSAEQITEGVEAIVAEIRKRCPESRVLLMGIFPRGRTPDAPERGKIIQINTALAAYADQQGVGFLDIGSKLLEPDGTLSPNMSSDALHPKTVGYEIWAREMDPVLKQMMAEPVEK